MARALVMWVLLVAGAAGAAWAQNDADGPGAVAGGGAGAAAGGAAAPKDTAADASDAKGRALLAQMVTALGGDTWLNRKNTLLLGRTSAFFQGKPTGDITDFQSLSTPTTAAGPGMERVEYTKHHDVVSLFVGNQAWEVTYRGKKAIPEEQAADYFRRRDHSVEEAVRVWLKDPATIVSADGQTTADRHLTDQVTLISASNDTLIVQLDTGTHLPLRRTFKWRDPTYKDWNTEVEEYDDYHTIEGIATPFTLTRTRNGDTVNQRYVYKVAYNVPVAPDAFDADSTATHLKR